MTEIFKENSIPDKTWQEIVQPSLGGTGSNGVLTSGGGQQYYYPEIYGGIFYGGSFKTNDSGARLEIFPDWDKTIGLIVYDNADAEVFKIIIDGTNVGDVVMGNYTGGQGAMWDKSLGTFSVAGAFTAGSIAIGTTPNWFKTDATGNSWWGGATLATALASINNAGVGNFANITITGGSVGGATVANIGYIGTTTADSVPTGLTYSTGGVSVGSDGSLSSYVIITWTAVASNTFDHYLIRYKKAALTYYTYIPANTNTITIEGLTPNVSYNFGVASVNRYGTLSDFSADIAQTTVADTVAPSTVTAGSATAGIQYVILEWTHNTDADLASYNIYRNTANDSATATLIGNCRTNYFIDGARTGAQIYYYWVKAIDTSGNLSASFSTVKSATPRNVTSDDVVTLAGSKVLIDGIVYLSNWRHSSDLTKIDGGIIHTNSITTVQLNFTPVQSTDVIAKINASVEGITIEADNITIAGSTTFIAEASALGVPKAFYTTPTTPYRVGDLWIGGSSGDLKKCITQRLTGAYQAGDWDLASKYTDDSGVTTIIGSTVTTSFVNALNVNAATVSASISITTPTITGGTITIGTDNNVFIAGANGIQLGHATFASAPFRVNMAGAAVMTSATIGNWTVNTTSIYTGTEDHSGYTANAGDITIYSDGSDSSIHAKNFYIDTAGVLNCTAAVISGAITTTANSSLDGQYLSAASVASASANLALRGWTFTGLFSATDYRIVAWTAGTFTASDGTAYSISSGNTGNMAALTYIYLDIAVSTTVLQITTTAATAIGNGKVLIAVAKNNTDTTSDATFQVYGGSGGQTLLVDNIAANSASTNEFVSNSAQLANLVVTDAKINSLTVAKLTAGSITSKAIALVVAEGTGDSYIAAGKTDFTNTDAGFILGIDDSDSNLAKFYIGNSTDYFNFNGANVSFRTSLADAITIDYGSNILLQQGGNIKFTSVTAPTACTATLVLTGTGNVDAGDHIYKVTYVNSTGETELGTASNTVTVDGTHKQVDLSAIPVSTSGGVTKRKIYRTKAGGTAYFLLTTINNNSATTYTDNTADANLDIYIANFRPNNSVGKIIVDGETIININTSDVAGVGSKPLNVFVGYRAGYSNNVGRGNSAIGSEALYSNISGTGNSAVGHNALRANTTGYSNVAIGENALAYNTEGSNNIGIGEGALFQITTGDCNVAIGTLAGYSNLTGDYNVAIGQLAGYSNSTASGCIFIGDHAGYYETGSEKLFIDNRSRTNEATARTSALLYGVFDATPVYQTLAINATATFLTFPITPSAAPDADYEVANKKYVDDKVLTYKNGTTTYNLATASGTQTIAHGLGKTPNRVRLTGTVGNGGATTLATSYGSYDSGSQDCVYNYWTGNSYNNSYAIMLRVDGSNYQYGSVSVDATNITITWTKALSPTGTANILWEVE